MTHQLHWRKSSYSDGHGGNCLEVAETTQTVHLRDSQHPELGHLTIPVREWRAFLANLTRDKPKLHS